MDPSSYPRKPLSADALAQELQGETANALGITGRRLAAAMTALADFDDRHASASTAHEQNTRRRLLQAASDRLLEYVIQKEMLGALDHALITQTFGITREVWLRMGVITPAGGS